MSGCGQCPRLKQETKSLFIDNTALSWKKMKKAFDGFNENLVVASVSPWLKQRAQLSPILFDKKHVVVYNGLDTSVFRLSKNNLLRHGLGLENKKIVFHVTSSFSTDIEHIKGGYYVLELARRFLKIDENVRFVVAGPSNSLVDLPSNVIYLGNIADQDKLAQWYSTSDVTLITSKKETFSMIVAESLCCGTPVVGFEAGAPEMIAMKEYSSFTPYGSLDELFNTLNRYLYYELFDKEIISSCAQKQYSRETMIDQYQTIYGEMLNK